MPQSEPSVDYPQDAITGTEPTLNIDEQLRPPAPVTEPQPPVLITEQQVMFGTAAAASPRRASIVRRMIDAFRVAADALRPPPPRPIYSPPAYFEGARMSREMDRL